VEPADFERTLLGNPVRVKRAASGHALPPPRSEGVSQGQVEREWGISHNKLHLLEQLGQIFSVRFGNKVIYSRAQLVQVLGEPPTGTQPPRLKRLGQSTDVSGR